jgi:asparagine synthase (glutamine-hydrolysing)
MPYLEPAITEHASTLRLEWKRYGDYEGELIRRADRRLAAYRSAYGHSFAASAPLSRRLCDYATYLRPPWLRRYTYRLKYRSRPAGDWPGYLGQAYRNAVLPEGLPRTGRLFRADRVADPDQFGRILSLEYALGHFDSRVQLEF